jgi:DNA-binding LytR/AlgR family response regulator
MKAVVAEDEALLRNELVSLLGETWPDLEIVAACEDGGSALDAIEAHRPGLAFLDIRMPGLTGLEVAAAATQASPATQVVFVTAYDQYAIDAFDRGAVDYLLKPVTRERLAATVKRVRARLDSGATDAAALASIIEQLRARLPTSGQPRASGRRSRGSPPTSARRRASSSWTTWRTSAPTTSTPSS